LILMRALKITTKLVAAGFLVYWMRAALFNPMPLMDEGYYLGATHAILRGDWLLHHYNFDKPFLLPFWPILGIGIFGETPLGFHFVPLLCMIGSFFCLSTILETLSGMFLPALLFSLFVMKIPVMTEHWISNFCEPYLLFSLLMMTRHLVLKHSLRQISWWFFIAFFTKISALLWFPLVFADAWIRSDYSLDLRGWLFWLKGFLRESWILIATGLFFSLLNATPFASILWFSGLTNPSSQSSFLGRILDWCVLFFRVLGPPPLAILLIGLFLTGVVLHCRKPRKTPILLLFLIPALLHFFAFPLSNAILYDRYLVQFLPLFLIPVFIVGARYFASALGVSVFAFFLIPAAHLEKTEADLQSGRNLYVVREALDRSSVYLNNGDLWNLLPFHDHLFLSGCTSLECVTHDRVGASVFPNHFVFNKGEIWKVPLVWPIDSHRVKSRVVTIPFDQEVFAEGILSELKLGRAVTLRSVEWSNHSQPSPEGFLPFFNQGDLNLITATKKRFLSFDQGTELTVEGKLAISRIQDVESRFPVPKYRFIFRVDAIRVNQKNWVDEVMPFFFRSYTLPLSVLPLDVQENADISAFQIDPSKNKASVTFIEAHSP